MSRQGKWPRKSLKERLLARVQPEPNSGCWLWTGPVQSRGYGLMCTRGESKQTAHRVAFEVFHRPLRKGEVVCHRCDVPICCNPEHLFAGSQMDNMHDMDAKGRRRCTSAVPPEVIAHIKSSPETPARLIAWCFGISIKTVRNYRNGATWRHA